jgi:hypothetical protein
MDEGLVRCSECHREVDEFVAISEQWAYWSDGCGELLAFCPECLRREFARDAPASGLVPLVLHRGAKRTDG